MTTRKLDVLLGLLFFSALLSLGAITIVLSDFSFVGERHDFEFISPDVGYLRQGDPVLVDGMPSGKVQFIERLGAPLYATLEDGSEVRCAVKVKVRMDVDLLALLFEDASIIIEDRGVLGGRMIRVLEGRSGIPRSPDKPLVAISSPPLVQALGGVVGDSADDIQATFANIRLVSERLTTGESALGRLISDEDLSNDLTTIIADVKSGAASFADFSDSFGTEGDGTLSKLINDPKLYDTALAAFEDIRGFTGGSEDGSNEGTLSKLMHDSELYDRALAAVDEINVFATDLNTGEGSLAKFINDPELFDTAKAMVTNINDVVEDLKDGKGLLATALNDEVFAQQARDTLSSMATAADDVKSFTAGLAEGKGLLSVLVNDEELAADVRELLAQLLSGLEDARETAPVQGVGGLLFGTF